MSAFVLKLIAIITMLIDHTGAVFPHPQTPELFRAIGRIAFPIFVYMIAEGCDHTRDMRKYLLRLGAFALISEIPFDLALNKGDINFLLHTNVFYTLFLGVLCVYLYRLILDKGGHAVLAVLPCIPIIFLGNLLVTDYFSIGVAWIFITYVVKKKPWRLLIAAAGVFYFYGFYLLDPQYWMPINVLYLVFGLLSVALLAFYNGKRGLSLKWVFYAFYPVHLLVLAVLPSIFA